MHRPTPDWGDVCAYAINLAGINAVRHRQADASENLKQAFQALERSVAGKAVLGSVMSIWDSADKMFKLLNQMGDSETGLMISRRARQLIETLIEQNPSLRTLIPADLTVAFEDAEGWWLMLCGETDAAEEIHRRVLAANPGSVVVRMNLAHCLLLTGRYDEAIAIYRAVASSVLTQEKTGTQLILEDFTSMRNAGIDHPNLAKAEASLTSGNARRSPDAMPQMK
jgi:tetratricopeptide (TPR) repeat protein